SMQLLRAGGGDRGQSGHRQGARGSSLAIRLPLGTSIREVASVLQDREEEPQAKAGASLLGGELDSLDWHALVAAKGGRGGRGNYALGRKNAEHERGMPGELRVYELDLKTAADVALVGLPSAGKSSFLASVSNARPRVADYPFTTQR